MCFIDWCKNDFSVAGAIERLTRLIWNQPQLAVLFAYFPPEECLDSQAILFLICCPAHMRDRIVDEIERGNIKSPSESDSIIKMIPGHDKAYVSLSGGIRAVDEDDMDKFHLRYVCT